MHKYIKLNEKHVLEGDQWGAGGSTPISGKIQSMGKTSLSEVKQQQGSRHSGQLL